MKYHSQDSEIRDPIGEYGLRGICLPRLHFFRTIKVNDRQAQFANEYLVDLNATQAAIRAGYSAKTGGSQGFGLLKKPEIQIAVQNAQAERIERTKVDADWVVSRLSDWLKRTLLPKPLKMRSCLNP